MSIANSSDILQAVIDATPDAIFVKDLEGRYVLVNDAAARFVGRSPAEIIGKRDFELYVEQTARQFVEDDRQVLATGLPQAFEGVATGMGGATQAYLVTKGVYRDPDGRILGLFGISHDITELQAANESLAQAREALFRSQKMEAVGQLTGGIAHDFNNLLTVVLGNLDLMERHVNGNERMLRQLAAMRHAAERGQTLTGQLLAFSRRQHLNPETLDVNTLVRGFEPLIRRVLGENIGLRISLEDKIPACEVDAPQLETSLLNLAVNARDAMPDGGEIMLTVLRVECADELIAQYSEAARGPWIVISVSDSGVGMPAHVVTRAFEPFFTTKDPGKGSGLGLSQVYGFVRQSGGFVTLTSVVGEGTRISIYLPPSGKPLTQRAPRESPSAVAAGSETVLLVEDDAAVLTLTSEMLHDLGYRVITAADADGALDILRNGQPIDLIFTDVVMREKSGVQLAREAREMRPGVKILLTSGYTGEALTRHKPDSLDLPIIAKPFRQAELGARLRKLLDEGDGRVVAAD
jgi:PAS domain S-box-containing protein